VRVITSFYDDSGVEYLITEPLEPVLIVAKPTNPDAKPKAKSSKTKELYTLLDADELSAVMPSVEGMLAERYEESSQD